MLEALIRGQAGIRDTTMNHRKEGRLSGPVLAGGPLLGVHMLLLHKSEIRTTSCVDDKHGRKPPFAVAVPRPICLSIAYAFEEKRLLMNRQVESFAVFDSPFYPQPQSLL